jgi:anti-sigma factor RsiW
VPDDESLLHAWLDGELTPEQRAEVDAWLRDHPEDAARVQVWAADRQALQAHFAPQLDEPVPERLAALLAPAVVAPRRLAPWQRWAAALAIFLLGGVLGAVVVGRLGPTVVVAQPVVPWAERAVVAHAVYVPEARHPVEVDTIGASHDRNVAQEQHLQGWLTKRLGLPVKLFDLRAQGYELIGGRLLPDAAGPGAQLMYQRIGATPGAEARITVYLRKPDAATPAAFRYEQRGALGMFYWIEGAGGQAGSTGYALVGAVPREQLLALAEAIYQQGK